MRTKIIIISTVCLLLVIVNMWRHQAIQSTKEFRDEPVMPTYISASPQSTDMPIPPEWVMYTDVKFAFKFRHPQSLLRQHDPTQYNVPEFNDKEKGIRLVLQYNNDANFVKSLPDYTYFTTGVYDIKQGKMNNNFVSTGVGNDYESHKQYVAQILANEKDQSINMIMYVPRDVTEDMSSVFERMANSVEFFEP